MPSRLAESGASEAHQSNGSSRPRRGTLVTYNQSRLKQFRRCQKMYSFRYDYPSQFGPAGKKTEMIPVKRKLPLYRGSWMHALQQALHYQWAGIEEWDFEFGEGRHALRETVSNWHDVQEILAEQFDSLFDEEREDLGDLADECERLFRSYLKFWDNDQERYTVVTLPNGQPAIEFLVTAPLARFGLKNAQFKGKIDLLVEDAEYGGMWIWDAKWVKRIPPPDERMMSPQAPLYVWGVRQTYDLDVRGFVFNYGRTKAPVIPRLLKSGVLSTAARIDTDYHTYLRTIKATHGKTWKRYVPYYMPKLRDLQGREALWFDRGRIPVEDERILRAIREGVATVRDIQRREQRVDYVPRSYFYSCKWACDYHELCTAEFQGLNIEPMINQTMQFAAERYTKEEDLLEG